ncbi:MAG TPA: prolyl oligopeptidase family serine peptidase [Vicinamibacterales bacterium]|nr:prolyl oligopeptidase family serine peptidase [Vicinamibacterales bacterium]
MAASQGLRLAAPVVDGDDIYWLEARPAEGGRNVVVRAAADGVLQEVTPAGFNVRSRVHEYGGGSYVVDRGTVFFSNFADQRLYRIDRPPAGSGITPVPITPQGRWHFADAAVDAARGRLICVREDHTVEGRECVNALVAVSIDGSSGAGRVLADGYDFYSTPRLSPDGLRLAWICWRHPNMPWDGTELWLADVAADGSLANTRRIAGGDDESIYQPGWSPNGELLFVSDRNDRWRLYRVREAGSLPPADQRTIVPVHPAPPADAEVGRPQWILGTATWVFMSATRLVVSYTREGRWFLGCAELDTGSFRELAAGVEPGPYLAPAGDEIVFVAGSATAFDAVIALDVNSGAVRTLRTVPGTLVDDGFLSVPEAVWFPTANAQRAHLFYYAPRNRDCTPVAGERPPLVVISHGGPIAAADSTLDYGVQFWTSRGFAVADVNYGGSTGFGRDYRRRLNGQWGIVDVVDCIRATEFLVAEGKANPARLIIRGGSAGGFTTLASLTGYPDVFKAGASYFGVSDLEALMHDSHKFEARCLDILVGPYPAEKARYEARSPIHHVDRLQCPLILLQGLEDKVVPPNQSEMMADALRRKGRPVAYITFAGEQHGFRKAENIIRSLEAELYFYGAVFGFAPADRIEPVLIENLPPR